MKKTIVITGATDGIGLATANMLAPLGHQLLLHGRSAEKLEKVKNQLENIAHSTSISTYVADLTELTQVASLAEKIKSEHGNIDVLINNAGVFKLANSVTPDGLDARFVVNTLAPYLLTKKLLKTFSASGRVINLSSAAQAPVNIDALLGRIKLDDMAAYAQSKLAITMWTSIMAKEHNDSGPVFISVNPGSLLASKMVKDGFGVAGSDLNIGADILTRLSLNEEFSECTGLYFDNDAGKFSSPHSEGLDVQKSQQVVNAIELLLT